MPSRKFELRINGPAGQQREIPRGTIVTVSYEDEQEGGQTSCSISTAVDVTGLPTIQNGDIVRVFVRHEGNRELRYYGKIVRREISEEDGISLSFTTEGESSEIGRVMLNREILEPGPPDISVLWSLLADDVRRKRPDLLVLLCTVGLTKTYYEAFYKNFGDASKDLIQAAGNRVGWGVRRTPLPPYTPVLSLDRKVQPTDPITSGRTIALPAKNVSTADGEVDASDIRNIMYLRGGVPINPNLVPNADFRLIELSGDNFRNLTKNGSFDVGDNRTPLFWTLLNGASKKSGGLSEGPTHGGDYMIELDHVNETVVQARTTEIDQYLIPGHTFQVQAWSRREVGAGTSKLRIEFYWRDASNAEISGMTQTFTILDAAWQVYGFAILCPTSGLAKGFRISLVSELGSVVVDDANVYDLSLVLPRFHELRLLGTATQEVANFVQTAKRHPYRSAYAPEFAVRCADANGNDAQFGLRNKKDGGEVVTFDVSGNATYRYFVDLISPRTPTGGNYKNGKLWLVVLWQKADGGQIGAEENYVIPAGAGFADWQQFSQTFTAPSNAAHALLWITFRGGPTYTSGELTALGIPNTENGLSRLIVGGFAFRLSGSLPQELPARYVGLPALPGVQYEWIPDGPYQTIIRCTDVMPVGTPEYNSIADYGEHPVVEQQDSITTQDEAQFFAQALFYAYGTENPNGSVTIEGDTRQFKACDGLRLRGKRGRAFASVLVSLRRVSVSYDGNFRQTLAWGIDRDNPYDLLTDLMERERKAGGSGAGGGYYGSSGGTAGGSTGGSTGGGTSGYEVIDARTRDMTTKWPLQVWDTLKQHLAAIWAAMLADPTTTKGDLLVRSATGLDRLPVGANGSVPTADDTQPLGVRWGVPSGASATRWEPLTNGDPTDPQLLFDEKGDVLMIEVTP